MIVLWNLVFRFDWLTVPSFPPSGFGSVFHRWTGYFDLLEVVGLVGEGH